VAHAGPLLIFIGVFVGAYFVVHWYAYSTYYLGVTPDRAVYQGQPSGILWFKPIKVADTNYQVSALRNTDQSQLSQTIPNPRSPRDRLRDVSL